MQASLLAFEILRADPYITYPCSLLSTGWSQGRPTLHAGKKDDGIHGFELPNLHAARRKFPIIQEKRKQEEKHKTNCSILFCLSLGRTRESIAQVADGHGDLILIFPSIIFLLLESLKSLVRHSIPLTRLSLSFRPPCLSPRSLLSSTSIALVTEPTITVATIGEDLLNTTQRKEESALRYFPTKD